MEALNIESLNELKKQVVARYERVSREGIEAAREGSDALKKAYAAQCKTGRELWRKSREILGELRTADPRRHLQAFGTVLVKSLRKSSDTWIELAESSLGRARKVLQTLIADRPTA